jgi:predicted CoA-binding protein
MPTLREAAEDFLSQKRIAVAGVSRDGKQPANLIYRRLRDTDHQVFPVNPNAQDVEGDHCFSSVTAIPDGVDGVVIVTPPEAALDVAGDCARAGVARVAAPWCWPRQQLRRGHRVLPRARHQRDSHGLPVHVRRHR